MLRLKPWHWGVAIFAAGIGFGARRDYGQRFWWRPGTALPRRGPDLGAVAP